MDTPNLVFNMTDYNSEPVNDSVAIPDLKQENIDEKPDSQCKSRPSIITPKVANELSKFNINHTFAKEEIQTQNQPVAEGSTRLKNFTKMKVSQKLMR